jgi:hypothetical protein
MISRFCPLLGAAAFLFAVACAPVPVTPPAALSGLRAPAQEFLDRLANQEATLSTVRGLASVRYEGAAGAGTVTQVIIVALPERGRLEALSPLGTAVLLLTIRGEDLTLYSPVRNEYGVGRATGETLGRLIQVPVPPGPLLRLLAGLPPLPIKKEDPRLQVAEEGEGITLESVDGPLWEHLWATPDGLAVERGELGGPSGPLLRFEFGDWRQAGTVKFPFAIRLEAASGKSRVTVRYETVAVNIPAEEGLFELPRPSSGQAKIIELSPGSSR